MNSVFLCLLAASILQSARDVAGIPVNDYGRHIAFSVSGTVTYESLGIFFVENEEGALLFSSHEQRHWAMTGDVIRVTGFTEVGGSDYGAFLNPTSVVRIASSPLPSPVRANVEDVLSGRLDCRRIVVHGILSDVYQDEVDSRWTFLMLNVRGRYLFAAMQRPRPTLNRLMSLVDAEVELTGFCRTVDAGKRKYFGRYVHLTDEADVRVLTPPGKDLFSVPPLGDLGRTDPYAVSGLQRRRLDGTVVVSWRPGNILLRDSAGEIHRIELAKADHLPAVGAQIQVAGFPETDLYRVNLARAQFRKIGAPSNISEAPADKALGNVFTDRKGLREFNTDLHGHPIAIEGVVRTNPDADTIDGRIHIECDGHLIPVIPGSDVKLDDRLSVGCRIRLSGICLFEAENWTPGRAATRIRDFAIVIRNASDIEVLSRPSWWTRGRLFSIILILAAAVGGILCWNAVLRRLIERRGRQLVRSQAEKLEADLRVDERTRIAAELHDYLAQNLTAVSYKLTAARAVRPTDPESADAQLETAAAMLDSSRTELRRCLWDLKSKALEEPTFELAIRRSLQQVTSLGNVRIAFDVSRTRISDPTAHAILSIIRELVANAVNHGLADRIAIRGKIANGVLHISVEDNGSGFDVDLATASDNGHFGLDGIRQRISRLNGTFDIVSQFGEGTKAIVRIPLHAAP